MPAVPMMRENDQTAHIIEAKNYAEYNSNTCYNDTFNLQEFPRALRTAIQFKWYRAKRVTYTYEPFFNTFQEGGGGAVPNTQSTKPYMYFLMNRTQDAITKTVPLFLQCGSQPQPFTKKLELSYRPNWLTPGLQVITGTSAPAFGTVSLGARTCYDWLPCPNAITNNVAAFDAVIPVIGPSAYNDPAVDMYPAPPATYTNISTGGAVYNGHQFIVDQAKTTDGQPIGRYIVTVEWEFKGANPAVTSSVV